MSNGSCLATPQISPGDRRVTLAKVITQLTPFSPAPPNICLILEQPARPHDHAPVFSHPPPVAGSVDDVEAPELFMGAQRAVFLLQFQGRCAPHQVAFVAFF